MSTTTGRRLVLAPDGRRIWRPPGAKTFRAWAPVALVVVTATLAAGCGGSDDDGGNGTVGGREGSGREATAPPGSDVEAVEPLVEELLVEYDEVVNAIVADPSVAADPDDELVRRYLDIHEPDSEFAQGSIEVWEANADDDIAVEPYDDEHPALTTRLDGPVETVSDDEVTVLVCEEHREIVTENGSPTQGVPLLEEGAVVTAVRVDDQWLLRDRVVRDDIVGCETTEGE